MSIIVACPSCGRKLRVSDDLRGQMARCPVCNHTFDTAQAMEPVPPAPASEPRSQRQELPLQLAIDEPSPEPRPAPSNKAPGLGDAVELKLSLDDDEPSPSRTPVSLPPEPTRSEPPKRTAPPRLADEHDDLKTCPVCGKHIHRDSRRCPYCSQRIVRGGPRHDVKPSRGALVLSLGVISLVCLVITCFPVGMILGLISWIMGQSDLRKIKKGDMDANGQGLTQAGWICGILGTALNGLLILGCLGFIGLISYAENNRPRNTSRIDRPVAPAPVPRFPNNNRLHPRRR